MPIGTGKKPENTVPMAREYPSHISVLLVVYGIDVRIPNRLILKFSGRNFSNYGMINQVCVVISIPTQSERSVSSNTTKGLCDRQSAEKLEVVNLPAEVHQIHYKSSPTHHIPYNNSVLSGRALSVHYLYICNMPLCLFHPL